MMDGLQELMLAMAQSMWLGCSAETSHDLESNDLACRGPHEQPTTEAPVGAANTLLAAPTGSTEPRAVVSCSCGPEQGFPEEGTNHRFPNHVLLAIARQDLCARLLCSPSEMSWVRVCP